MSGEAPLSNFSESVQTERISDVLQRMPLVVAVNVVNAGATAWVLARVEPWPGPAIWFAVVALISLVRLALWRQDRRSRLPPASRVAMVTLTTLATGLAWGLGTGLLLPDKPDYRVFVVFVVGGMCAGSVTTNAMHFPSLASFVLGASLPVAGRFLAEGSRPDLMMGGMILVFAAALLCTGRQFSRGFGERAMLRWRLGEANLRLRQEIDDHKTTSASLRESQKLEAIGRLTAGIAHDFNNLLMSIGGNIDLLRARSNGPEAIRRLEAMRGAVERGSLLTRQFLAFGRRQRLTPRIVDLNGILADTVRLLASVLGQRIAVVLQSGAEVWPVFVDPGQVEHAIFNLALNARDAMPNGGTITIGTANRSEVPRAVAADLAPGAYVELSVADTGGGMAEDVLTRAVEPFYTTKEPGRGSGLGLSQVYGIARQSGGTLLIESAPGHGTIVRLFLPRAHETVGAAQQRN
jgi:signal transduction histidine kinase